MQTAKFCVCLYVFAPERPHFTASQQEKVKVAQAHISAPASDLISPSNRQHKCNSNKHAVDAVCSSNAAKRSCIELPVSRRHGKCQFALHTALRCHWNKLMTHSVVFFDTPMLIACWIYKKMLIYNFMSRTQFLWELNADQKFIFLFWEFVLIKMICSTYRYLTNLYTARLFVTRSGLCKSSQNFIL